MCPCCNFPCTGNALLIGKWDGMKVGSINTLKATFPFFIHSKCSLFLPPLAHPIHFKQHGYCLSIFSSQSSHQLSSMASYWLEDHVEALSSGIQSPRQRGGKCPPLFSNKTTGSPCLPYATPLCSRPLTCLHDPHRGFPAPHGAFQYFFIKKFPITSPCSELPYHS